MKVFSDEFMKFWYIAALLVVLGMFFSMRNDASVSGYELTTYNTAGIQEKKETINSTTISEESLENLPVSKSFVPKKRF